MAAMDRTGRIGSALFTGLSGFVCTVIAFGVATGPAAATPGAGQTTTPAPQWGSCDELIADAYLPTALCTTVPVPIDDADPTGAQAQLAVIKIPATEARRLVVRGFFAELIARIGVPEVEARLIAAVEAELEGAVA